MEDKGFKNENDHLLFEGDKDIRKLVKEGIIKRIKKKSFISLIK